MHYRDEWKNNQNDGRFPPHNNMPHRPYVRRSASPNFRRSPSFDNVNRYKTYRNFSPPRGLGNRRYPFPPHPPPPRYPEQAPYKNNEWDFHEQRPQGRYMDHKIRPFRGERGGRPFRGTFSGSHQRGGRWNENDNFRHQRMPADDFSQFQRRSPEGFGPRNSFHKRFPEDHEFKEYGPIPKRGRGMERHENRDPERHPRWTPDRSPPFTRRGPERFSPRARPSVERENAGNATVSKVPLNFGPKPQRYQEGKQTFHGQGAKSARWEDRKGSVPRNSSHDKDIEGNRDKKIRPTEEGSHKADFKKYPKDNGEERPVSSKSKERVKKDDGDVRPASSKPRERVKKEDADVKSAKGKLKERVKKEMDTENDPDSTTSMHEKIQTLSELKTSANGSPRTKLITVKVDTKKMEKYRLSSGSTKERQVSQDLVAASKKEESFHPVFEHIDSASQSGQNSPKSKFIQDVITITHHVKANYFKSSGLTLHERFSKLKDKPAEDAKEAVARPDPEIHRRIDISLADLQNKRSNRTASEQIRISGASLFKGKPLDPECEDSLSD